MPIPVQQFQSSPSGVAAGLSKMLQGGMAGYGQAQKIKQAKQMMQMQQHNQQLMEEKSKKQDFLTQQFAKIMGRQASPGVQGDTGSGYLGGQITDDIMRGQLAKVLGASGNYGKAADTLFPRQGNMTAMQKNLSSAGYDLQTPEGQQAAKAIMSGNLLPTSAKAARYASSEVQGIIDRVDDNSVIDSVAKYSGLIGAAKLAKDKSLSMIGVTDPDYKKYFTFIHNTVPALASGVRRLLGDNASSEQIKQIEKLSDPSSWSGDPDLVKARWKELNALHKIASKSMNQNPLDLVISSQNQNVPRGTNSSQKTGTIRYKGNDITMDDIVAALVEGK